MLASRGPASDRGAPDSDRGTPYALGRASYGGRGASATPRWGPSAPTLPLGPSPQPIPEESFDFPAPLVGGTEEADALAKAAGRCGQADFAWLDGDRLGTVTSSQPKAKLTKEMLQSLAAGAKLELPISFEYDVETRIITYVTQDRGKEVEATAAVAFPVDVPEDAEALPTLLVLHGTSGFTDGCGPSREAEARLLGAALASSGFIVVAPDYIGLKNTEPPTGFSHPYLAGQPTAIASFDAVRALRQLAPYYARELDLVGIVATVPGAESLRDAMRRRDASSLSRMRVGWAYARYELGSAGDSRFPESEACGGGV